MWNIQGITVAIGIIGVLLMGCGMSGEQQEAKAEEERKGFHCLSAWDGNHDGLEGLVRQQLNDPDSMETHETRIAPAGTSNQHRIIISFGARNAFGGMVRHTAIGWIDHDSCEATLVSVD